MSSEGYSWVQRPLAGGVQIARAGFLGVEQRLGTLGCFVRQVQSGIHADDPVFLLTAGHVLDPSLKDGFNPIDSVVHQPTASGYTNEVATVDKDNVVYGGSVDAGIAMLSDGVKYQNYVWKFGNIKGITDPVDGMIVMKHGRSTGRTIGQVVKSSYAVNTGKVFFTDLFQINFLPESPDNNSKVFAEEGDSGAPIMTGDGLLVGLLHAAEADGGIGCKISNIFKRLNLKLA